MGIGGRRAMARVIRTGEPLATGIITGLSLGVVSSLFLLLLAQVTQYRQHHTSLVWALPAAGFCMGRLTERWGTKDLAANPHIRETHATCGPPLPRYMMPLILFGTLGTHLFGGSAGREGAAVQMGASLGERWAQHFGAAEAKRRRWLEAGVAAGFASVFGTPLAAMVFVTEFFASGCTNFKTFVAVALAAMLGDRVVRALGVSHMLYPHPADLTVDKWLLGKWALFACAMAVATYAFVTTLRGITSVTKKLFPSLAWRMAVGGALIIILSQAGHASACLGLGTESIARAFTDPALPAELFLMKILATALTLGTGYLGGEVTPLFFVGASLGNVLAPLLSLPLEMSVAVGMLSTFAGAADAPLAATVLAYELFGFAAVPHLILVLLLGRVLKASRKLCASRKRPQRPNRFLVRNPR